MNLFSDLSNAILNLETKLTESLNALTGNFDEITLSVTEVESTFKEIELLVQEIRAMLDVVQTTIADIVPIAQIVAIVVVALFLFSSFCCGCFSASLASKKGRNSVLYFFLGLLTFSKPLVYLSALPDLIETSSKPIEQTDFTQTFETPVIAETSAEPQEEPKQKSDKKTKKDKKVKV